MASLETLSAGLESEPIETYPGRIVMRGSDASPRLVAQPACHLNRPANILRQSSYCQTVMSAIVRQFWPQRSKGEPLSTSAGLAKAGRPVPDLTLDLRVVNPH